MEKRVKKEKRQKLFFSLCIMLFMAMCGGIGGYTMAELQDYYFPNKEIGVGEFLYIIAAILVMVALIWLLHTYLHEIGHLLAGLLSGYRFQSIRFGSFMFIKTESGIKLRRLTIAGTGGQCLMFPPDEKGDDYPTFFYNMGGCFANLLIAFLSIMGYAFGAKNKLLDMVLLFSFLTGVGMALVNGIPMSSLSNDGYNVGILRKDAKARGAFKKQLNINNLLAQGASVKEMPESWFAWDEKIPENNLTASAAVMRFGYLMECQRFEEAQKVGTFLLENAVSLASVHESLIKAELLFCDMMAGVAPEKITECYEKEKKRFDTLKQMVFMQRILYAYYILVVKDAKKAEESLTLFEKLAKKYPYPAEIEVERELIALVKEKEAEC